MSPEAREQGAQATPGLDTAYIVPGVLPCACVAVELWPGEPKSRFQDSKQEVLSVCR